MANGSPVYPYIENGDLDEVMERKAESGDKTAGRV